MTRFMPLLAVGLATLMLAAPTLGADYQAGNFDSGEGLRSGFASDWDNTDTGSPLSFELGVRYWYSWGAQSFSVGPYSLTESDQSHSVEGHFRIDDASTKTYVKGLAGLSFKIDGTGGGNSALTGTDVTDGHIFHAGGDIGYSWLGDAKSNASFGPMVGYMHWNDSPNIGRQNFTVGSAPSDFTYDSAADPGERIIGPEDSKEDDVEINALRLGFSGKVNLGTSFDVSGELAAVPYAKIHGTLGAFGVTVADDGSVSRIQSSAADIDGWGYGAMGEVMVGFHPTQNLVLRLGGRAWYLQGRSDTTFNTIAVTDTDPVTVIGSQRYISTANPWSLFRYGLLTELTYSF